MERYDLDLCDKCPVRRLRMQLSGCRALADVLGNQADIRAWRPGPSVLRLRNNFSDDLGYFKLPPNDTLHIRRLLCFSQDQSHFQDEPFYLQVPPPSSSSSSSPSLLVPPRQCLFA